MKLGDQRAAAPHLQQRSGSELNPAGFSGSHNLFTLCLAGLQDAGAPPCRKPSQEGSPRYAAGSSQLLVASRVPLRRTANTAGWRRLLLRAVRGASGKRDSGSFGGCGMEGAGFTTVEEAGQRPRLQLSRRWLHNFRFGGAGRGFLCWGPLSTPRALIQQWDAG